jgi:SWIM zinc finger
MDTLQESVATVNFHTALLAASERAQAAHPGAGVRIAKGLALVLDDAVTDWTRMTPSLYTVKSAVDPLTVYRVVSNGTTTCTCPDYASHGIAGHYVCKHGYSVLLLRAARRDMAHATRLRHGYHLVSGEEGHVRHISNGRVEFYPGGHKFSFVCMRDEVCLGPFINEKR